MYDRGRDVPENTAEALRWYRLAAEQGHVGAQNNLGVMYDEGRGVSEDDRAAVNWYRTAADQGFSKRAVQSGCDVLTRPGRSPKRHGSRAVVPQGSGPGPRGRPVQPGPHV